MAKQQSFAYAEELKAYVERIERLEEEKRSMSEDIRSVYAEAKANGYSVRALRAIIKLRGEDAAEREIFEAVLATYMAALGILRDTPLGEASLKRAAADFRKIGDVTVDVSRSA